MENFAGAIGALDEYSIFPRESRLINLSGRASPSGGKPREFEREIYLLRRRRRRFLIEKSRNEVVCWFHLETSQ